MPYKGAASWLSSSFRMRGGGEGGGGGQVLLGILGGGVPPRSPNHDSISDQKMSFSKTGIFRTDL